MKPKMTHTKTDLKKTTTLFVIYFILLLSQNSAPKFGILQLCFEYFSKGILAFPSAFRFDNQGVS